MEGVRQVPAALSVMSWLPGRRVGHTKTDSVFPITQTNFNKPLGRAGETKLLILDKLVARPQWTCDWVWKKSEFRIKMCLPSRLKRQVNYPHCRAKFEGSGCLESKLIRVLANSLYWRNRNKTVTSSCEFCIIIIFYFFVTPGNRSYTNYLSKFLQ